MEGMRAVRPHRRLVIELDELVEIAPARNRAALPPKLVQPDLRNVIELSKQFVCTLNFLARNQRAELEHCNLPDHATLLDWFSLFTGYIMHSFRIKVNSARPH
jgi:hypothetical protein